MRKINLLENAPAIKRRFDTTWRTDKNRIIAKRFDKEFFDGDRVNGYGGYKYDGRWKAVAQKLNLLYDINEGSSLLDVGCAKGFLLYDLREVFPGINVAGVDVSKYAIENAMDGYGDYIRKTKGVEDDLKNLEKNVRDSILPLMLNQSADNLPYVDNSFDTVISINTLHNLPYERCQKAIREMTRVCKGNNMFIQVDSYENESQKKALDAWNLTAKTALCPNDWLALFEKVGYEGDYYWTLLNPKN